MSKQRRTASVPGRSPESAAEQARAALVTGLGNSDLQARLGGAEVAAPESAGLDVVRDTALPLLDRAAVALEITPRGPINERLVEIIAQSALPADRKAELHERLVHSEGLAAAIHGVVERLFGADTPEVRAAVTRDLGQLESALMDGQATHGGWRVNDVVVALSPEARDGATSSRAEALIGDLARALTPDLGPAEARAACRELHALLLALDEDEDEDLGPDAPIAEEG